jgi:membrane protein DedA with SNARE-associated domain
VQATLQFLTQHGYSVTFLWMFLHQVGIPLPAIPILLAAGALAAMAKLSTGLVLVVAVVGTLLGDALWYVIGRQKGSRVLKFLCAISLEPDSCVRNTQETFARHGARSLLAAKFIPGLGTAAAPLAGVVKMSWAKFLGMNTAGTAIFVGLFFGIGYLAGDQLEKVAAQVSRYGAWIGGALVLAFAIWLGRKIVERRRFLASLRMARITPEQLKDKIDRGDPVAIIDLRHVVDYRSEPRTLPGALRMNPEEVEARHQEIPRDREVVLYCS